MNKKLNELTELLLIVFGDIDYIIDTATDYNNLED